MKLYYREWKETFMKKNVKVISALIMAVLLLTCASQQTVIPPDDANIIEIYIPACDWADTAYRVRSTLEKVKGVYQVKTDTARHKATVWYDGRSTNVQQFVKALKRANFEVERTVQIKWNFYYNLVLLGILRIYPGTIFVWVGKYQRSYRYHIPIGGILLSCDANNCELRTTLAIFK